MAIDDSKKQPLTTCIQNNLQNHHNLIHQWCADNHLVGRSFSQKEFDALPTTANTQLQDLIAPCFTDLAEEDYAIAEVVMVQILAEDCQVHISHSEL